MDRASGPQPHPGLIGVSCGAGSTRCAAPSVANTNRLMQSAGVSARRLSWFQCRSIAGVAEDGSPAAPIGGTILIPLWLGFGLGHAPRGPGAAGKESHHPGPAPPRLALDDPFKMPPSAGFSRIAVEMELVSHVDHPDGRDRRQGTVGSWPENTSRPRL